MWRLWLCGNLLICRAYTASQLPIRVGVSQMDQWQYDFTLMTFAGFLVFGFVLSCAVGLWVALRYIGAPLRLTELLCLYGYSTLMYIPAAVRHVTLPGRTVAGRVCLCRCVAVSLCL
jgi:hypothetical protein